MKNDFLFESFSVFEINNNEKKLVNGGRTPLTGVITGTNGSGANSTVDVDMYNSMGVLVEEHCGMPDSEFGGNCLEIGCETTF